MPSRLRADVRIDPPFRGEVGAAWLRRVARTALAAEGVRAAEVGIVITDDEAVRELNRTYAGEDETTDVLSFSLQEGEAFPSPDGLLRLGEVVISLPMARRQAQAAGRSLSAEVAHLLVHGILHLLGYDHALPQEEARMRERERTILARVSGEN
ncbi:MAG TPA: rRNA maturation RNase YbeY [Dehalococcoidia bacterium]|nr:rRNA maturation RNase YbeY [Dehalococcoidia bacterium]